MTPYVYTFIVHHKETAEYFLRRIEVNSIAMCDMAVILHILRSMLVMADEVFFFLIDRNSLLLFFCWGLRHIDKII